MGARGLLWRVGLFDLPWGWLLGGAAASILVILPLWLLLPSPFPRFPTRRAAPLVLASACILTPFAAVALRAGLVASGPDPGWWVGALVLVPAALAEELQFRGFLLDLLSRRGGTVFAVAASSLVFAAVHLDNPGSEPVGIVNIALFGVVLGALRVRGSGIVGLTALHWLWNLMTGMVFGWKVSGLELPSLFRPAHDSFGGFGPEASPILTLALAAAFLCIIFEARGCGCANACLPAGRSSGPDE